jgi:CheY-like chemotaxis protein
MTKNTLILIIDDDNRNIFALKMVLKSKGFDCIAANSVKEGITLLEQHPETAMILMDMMMPEIDGYEGINVITHHEKIKKIPVIAVTAQAMLGDKEKCLAAGATDYISKPIDIDKLLNSIAKILNDRT